MPTLSGVIPNPARTSIWPFAVAPPWLPIAGTINGLAPACFNKPAISRRINAKLAMPRLPAVTATESPGLTRSSSPGFLNSFRTAAATSFRIGLGNCCRTRTSGGMITSDSNCSITFMIHLGRHLMGKATAKLKFWRLPVPCGTWFTSSICPAPLSRRSSCRSDRCRAGSASSPYQSRVAVPAPPSYGCRNTCPWPSRWR